MISANATSDAGMSDLKTPLLAGDVSYILGNDSICVVGNELATDITSVASPFRTVGLNRNLTVPMNAALETGQMYCMQTSAAIDSPGKAYFYDAIYSAGRLSPSIAFPPAGLVCDLVGRIFTENVYEFRQNILDVIEARRAACLSQRYLGGLGTLAFLNASVAMPPDVTEEFEELRQVHITEKFQIIPDDVIAKAQRLAIDFAARGGSWPSVNAEPDKRVLLVWELDERETWITISQAKFVIQQWESKGELKSRVYETENEIDALERLDWFRA